MEQQTGEPLDESNKIAGITGRINRRIKRTLANPNLTPEQIQEAFTLANLSVLALYLGNPIAVDFTEEFIKYTNPFMTPEETTAEQV